MPGMLGTEFIKKTGLNTMVIFTTAYTNYAIEGYDLGIIDFLLKPFSFDRFFQAVERVTYLKKNIQTTDNSWDTPTLYLRSNYSYVKINLDNVLYIKGLEDYCKFYFKNESPVIFRITMKMLETKLPKGIFIRVHKSYIVRIDKADKKRASFLYISDTKIPIGRIYKKDVATTFEKLCPPNTRI
jgi:DNA-binding LytR/AlgR family response regulator